MNRKRIEQLVAQILDHDEYDRSDVYELASLVRDGLKNTPLMFSVRLKAHPDRFIGKKQPTYAFASDKARHDRGDDWHDKGFVTAHWFCKEQHARVWTKESALKRALTASGSGKWDEHTWSAYEVVHADGRVEPLDDLLNRWKAE